VQIDCPRIEIASAIISISLWRIPGIHSNPTAGAWPWWESPLHSIPAQNNIHLASLPDPEDCLLRPLPAFLFKNPGR
jgi:hypothetical protein